MSEFQIMTIVFLFFVIILIILSSYIFYLHGCQIERKKINTEYYNHVIKDILGEMYIDEQGNNVLQGGNEEYKNKWKYEIGYNQGLQNAIKILKSNINT